jgi:hypothetical protein
MVEATRQSWQIRFTTFRSVLFELYCLTNGSIQHREEFKLTTWEMRPGTSSFSPESGVQVPNTQIGSVWPFIFLFDLHLHYGIPLLGLARFPIGVPALQPQALKMIRTTSLASSCCGRIL